jgi:hypothetical protein
VGLLATLTISGVAMPTPSELTVAVQDISKADRNANGTMVLERIATKQKISCKWGFINDYNLSIILNAISGTTFLVTYVDPVKSTYVTKNMYCGDRQAGYIIVQESGAILYKDFTVDFIEI